MIFLQNLSYTTRKIDASLNTHFFKISVVAHSIIYNTLMKKGVFAYLHDFAVYFPHKECRFIFAYLLFSLIFRIEQKIKNKTKHLLTISICQSNKSQTHTQ